MFTIQVLGLGPLKRLLLPLIAVAKFGDIECTPTSVSLIVTSQYSHSFIAVLRLFDPFFTILSSGSDGNYRSNIQLDEFLRSMFDIGTDDLFLTILLPKAHTQANLIYTTRIGDFQTLTPLKMLPPQNEEVDEINYEMFIAIDAAAFREIAINFAAYHTTILVGALASKVTFTNQSRTVVLTAAQRQCMVGGDATKHDFVGFSIVLNPVEFFVQASFYTNLVWLFWSTDRCAIIKFFTGKWNHIVAYYPQRRMRSTGIVLRIENSLSSKVILDMKKL